MSESAPLTRGAPGAVDAGEHQRHGGRPDEPTGWPQGLCRVLQRIDDAPVPAVNAPAA